MFGLGWVLMARAEICKNFLVSRDWIPFSREDMKALSGGGYASKMYWGMFEHAEQLLKQRYYPCGHVRGSGVFCLECY